MGIIYKITSPKDKIYIGKTYDLRKRINSHKSVVRKGLDTNSILHNSIRKYGWESHRLDIVEEVADELLNEREMYWIFELGSFYLNNKQGMNMTLGGDGQRCTWKHDLERVAKFKQRVKENGANFKGKKHTEETKKIMSEKAKKNALEKGTRVPKWGAEKGREIVRKKCLLYNSEGFFVDEFNSLTSCANSIKVKRVLVSESIIKKRWIHGTYKVILKEDNVDIPKTIPTSDKRFKQEPKEVKVFDKENKLVGVFANAEAASLEINVPCTTIRRAARYNNKRPIRKGYYFVYSD